jgi:hypothetical protein
MIEDVIYNRFAQVIDRKVHFYEYMEGFLDRLRVNYHFIGQIKKII